MGSEDLISVLNRFELKDVTSEIVENWANSIECRDDIDFESEELKEAIHKLASPELFGEINSKEIMASVKQK